MIKKDTGQNLLRYKLKDFKFLIYDYETCNLNLCIKNLPWEVGYMFIENGEIQVRENRRMKWKDLNLLMSEGAARITHFAYQEYINNSEDAKLVLEEFEKLLFDPSVINVTYNGLNFDMYLHQLWRKELGLPADWSFLFRSIDILSLARAYRLEMQPPEKGEDFFLWQMKLANYYSDPRLRKERKKGLKGCSLGPMAKELGIPVDDTRTHQGLYDVELTWKILQQLIWKMNLTTDHLMVK
jgi:DNA polymerase III epsilon subunit-like protein